LSHEIDQMQVQADVRTLQLDLCRNLEMKFVTISNLPNITWAGVYNMSIAFDDERMSFCREREDGSWGESKIEKV
jgi:hypothetical protein